MPPPSLNLIPALLTLVKNFWDRLPSTLLIPRKIEHHYKTHGWDLDFLLKHPIPNSIVVKATQYKSHSRSSTTPVNKEGRKIDSFGKKLYSLAALLIRISNYQAAMDTYQKHLWDRILPSFQTGGICVKLSIPMQ